MQITDELILKLQKLINSKQFSTLEFEIESLGEIEKLPNNILMIYACCKAMSKHTTKDEYIKISYYFDKIFSSEPENIEAFYNLIKSSLTSQHFEFLKKHVFKQYEKDPKNKLILEALYIMHYYLGDMELASRYYKEFLNLNPKNIKAWTEYLGGLLYHDDLSQLDYLNECKNLSNLINKNDQKFTIKKSNKIRLCFISPDFSDHPVAFFCKDLFKKIDKNKFELIALSNKKIINHDKTTDEIKSNFSIWKDVYETKDEDLVKLALDLKLDILIDLSGFTTRNRISVTEYRVAPIQISWLGYCNTLGLSNIDYIIFDRNLVSPEEESLYSEKILYMPKTFAALTKPNDHIEIKNKFTNDEFIFGSFNNLRKISKRTFDIWSEILKKTNSKLFLRTSTQDTSELRENVLKKFRDRNVNIEQIEISSTIFDKYEHLNSYNKINLTLDPFPFPGATTSFESNYMGVPVLTLRGKNSISRFGVTINLNLGLDNMIANNIDEYIAKAIDFSKNKKKLEKISGENLRSIILNSPLFDTDDFTKNFEDLLINLVEKNTQ